MATDLYIHTHVIVSQIYMYIVMTFMAQELQTNINLESSSKFDLIIVISPSSGPGEVEIL